jgi:hypothetical protein
MLITAVRVFQLRLPTQSIRFLRPPRSYRSLSTMGAIGTQTVDTRERLSALRSLMADRNIDAYIVPSEDQRRCSTCSFRETSSHIVCTFPDFSEYPAECDKRRAFISGFNGSAGLSPQCPTQLSILIPFRHCDRDKGQSISFHRWTLLPSGRATT